MVSEFEYIQCTAIFWINLILVTMLISGLHTKSKSVFQASCLYPCISSCVALQYFIPLLAPDALLGQRWARHRLGTYTYSILKSYFMLVHMILTTHFKNLRFLNGVLFSFRFGSHHLLANWCWIKSDISWNFSGILTKNLWKSVF